jgi:hypothetical protein
MTILLKKPFLVIPINCHPVEAYPDFLPRCPGHDTTAYAAFIKESRKKFTNATNLNRKSGVAQWRDLLFPFSRTPRGDRSEKQPRGFRES